MAEARGTLQSPPGACSPRKLTLAALFTSAEWHLVSRAEDSLFPKDRKKISGLKKRGFAHCPLLKSLCLMLCQEEK